MRPPLSRSNHQEDNVNQELKKGSWDEEEDRKLMDHISRRGPGNWQSLPERAGLNRCGKSCRLRWINYLRPGIKRGNFTPEEDQKIIELHAKVGNKWSFIATYLEGRTDNEIKNYWNTKLSKRLFNSGIDPTTHLPIPADLTRLLHNRSGRIIIYNNPILPINPLDNLNSGVRPVHEYIYAHGQALQLINNVRTLNPTFYGGPESNFLGPSYGFGPPHDLNAISIDPNSQASSSINHVNEYAGSNNETLLFYDGYQENDGMMYLGSGSTSTTTPNMSNEHNWQLPELVNHSTPVQVSSDHVFSNDNNQEFLSGHTTDFVDAADAMNYDDDMWGTVIGDGEVTGSFFLKDNVFDGSFP